MEVQTMLSTIIKAIRSYNWTQHEDAMEVVFQLLSYFFPQE